MSPSPVPPLPARVRVTRPPLPLAPALRGAAGRLCPGAPQDALTAAALAVAGGSVIGAALAWDGGEALGVESAWRGRGIEKALTEVLEAARQSP